MVDWRGVGITRGKEEGCGEEGETKLHAFTIAPLWRRCKLGGMPSAPAVALTVDIDRESPGFAAFLESEGKTVDQFDAELLPRIRGFVDLYRDRLATVLVRLEGAQIYVTLGLRDVPFDFELCDAESLFLLQLCHKHRWHAVQMLQWPGNPTLADLRYASANAAEEGQEGG